MKMHYADLKERPELFKCLTGLSSAEFEALLPNFEIAWNNFVQKTFEREDRKRARGAGRKAELNLLEDKLLFIVVYFRQYPTQAVQGHLFGIGQPQANEWVHRLASLLNQATGCEQKRPDRRPAKLLEVFTACPGLESFLKRHEPLLELVKHSGKQEIQPEKKTYYSTPEKLHAAAAPLTDSA